MGNQRLAPTMSAPSLATVVHPGHDSGKAGPSTSEENLSHSLSNPSLVPGLSRRLEGDLNRVYSAPDFKRKNSSVNNLLSNDNDGNNNESEESLRLDNLILQNMRTKIRIEVNSFILF
jgi:hypothetical protein